MSNPNSWRLHGLGCWLGLFCVALGACGGGGGGSGSTTTPATPPASVGVGTIAAQAPALPTNNAAYTTCPQTPAAGTGTAPANAGQPGVISGRVSYDRVPFFASIPGQTRPGLNYNGVESLPARGVVVEAVAPTGSVCSGTVVNTTVTDGDGWYALPGIGTTQQVCVRVRAQLYRSGTPAWNIVVADNTDSNKLYVMADSRIDTPVNAPARDLHAPDGWNQGYSSAARVAAPFAIIDTACRALNAVLTFKASTQFGPLGIFWSINNTTESGDLTAGKIGGPFFDPAGPSIYLRGDADVNTDEFDEMVITHEFGHFVTHTLSRSDSIGGKHDLFSLEDPRLAFDEGWATAFAGLVVGTSLYRDSEEGASGLNPDREFSFDIEAAPSNDVAQGWYAEASMQRILYKVGVDASVSEQNNGLGLGLGGLLQTLSSSAYRQTPALASVFSFSSRLIADNAANGSAISNLLTAETINGNVDAFASTETHAPTASHTDLPVYQVMNTLGNGGAKTVCSTDVNGTPNTLSNRRYIEFIAPASSKFKFSVLPLAPSGAGILGTSGIELLDRGTYLVYQEGTTAGANLSITSPQALVAGQAYVLGVFHVGNAVSGTSVISGDNVCFKVTAVTSP